MWEKLQSTLGAASTNTFKNWGYLNTQANEYPDKKGSWMAMHQNLVVEQAIFLGDYVGNTHLYLVCSGIEENNP